LAAEQINAEGGLLGGNVTIVAEDDDSFSGSDISVASNALTRLITVDEADYVIAGGQFLLPYQDLCAEHEKILLSIYGTTDNYTQRVLEDYSKYKYSFRVSPCNQSTANAGILDDILTVCNYTGFTEVALLQQDLGPGTIQLATALANLLPKDGIELVYSSLVPVTTTDFASYFAAIEETGAEVLFPMIATDAVVSFVKEWYERQSPFVLWGVMWQAAQTNFWTLTEGRCDTVSFAGQPAVGGYPLTNKTLPARNAYIERWGEVPTDVAIGAYDALRFILSDAIRGARTTETEAVIRTLETVNVETTSARHFVFTSSHDVMVGSGSVNDPAEDYTVMCIFQWQNGTQVPMRPEALMREAEASYKYPSWTGPWSY
jgi:ABC-type branched-subunit amino acid transport system substrate-binding protein